MPVRQIKDWTHARTQGQWPGENAAFEQGDSSEAFSSSSFLSSQTWSCTAVWYQSWPWAQATNCLWGESFLMYLGSVCVLWYERLRQMPCPLIPSLLSFLSTLYPSQTKRQQSVLRDLRPQMGLIKEGSGTPGTNSSLSRAVPSKAQREDKEKMTREQEFNRRVRSRDTYRNTLGPFLHQNHGWMLHCLSRLRDAHHLEILVNAIWTNVQHDHILNVWGHEVWIWNGDVFSCFSIDIQHNKNPVVRCCWGSCKCHICQPWWKGNFVSPKRSKDC